uniref:Uncharacterized protein n=1 Tax=Ixodes scapularis TaxID=6945 RepID=A0A4D5RY40_IXOSC
MSHVHILVSMPNASKFLAVFFVFFFCVCVYIGAVLNVYHNHASLWLRCNISGILPYCTDSFKWRPMNNAEFSG